MSFYSRLVALQAELETTFQGGGGCAVQVASPTSGAVPTGAVSAIIAGGTGFPNSQTLGCYFLNTAGVAVAYGTVTTNGSGVVTAASVTNGGAGYSSKGTGTSYTSTAAGFAIGTTQIPLITGTGTVLPGDVVTFAGDTNKYTVTVGISGPGTITIASPGLAQAIPAAATAMTIGGVSLIPIGKDLSYGQWMGLNAGYVSDTLRRGVLIGSDFSHKFYTNMIERDVLRGFMGGKENIPANTWIELSFTTEMSPSGTLGIAPAWNKLVQGSGFSESYTASGGNIVKYDYVPVSDNFPSLSLGVRFGGVFLKIKGARVTKMEMDFTNNSLPTCKWTIVGMYQGMVQQAFAQNILTQWPTPLAILDSNTGDIRMDGGTVGAITAGPSYSTNTGAISGGTVYASQGMKLVVDTNAKFRPFLGGDSVPITSRESSGEVVADLSDTLRLVWYSQYQLNALTSASFQLGTVSGNIMRVFMPNAERQMPENVDDDGLLLTKQPFRCRPSTVNGNDEVRFVCM